jgi:hypothetical protein
VSKLVPFYHVFPTKTSFLSHQCHRVQATYLPWLGCKIIFAVGKKSLSYSLCTLCPTVTYSVFCANVLLRHHRSMLCCYVREQVPHQCKIRDKILILIFSFVRPYVADRRTQDTELNWINCWTSSIKTIYNQINPSVYQYFALFNFEDAISYVFSNVFGCHW